MAALLGAYTVDQIVIFIVLLLLAIKEGLNVLDFFKERLSSYFISEQNKEKNAISLLSLNNKLEEIESTIKLLRESDKDDIKGWLVEKHEYYKDHPQKKISENTMETIERRYSHYKAEGGNSYIDVLVMPELRAMTKEGGRNEF